jgi:hypothetical protein
MSGAALLELINAFPEQPESIIVSAVIIRKMLRHVLGFISYTTNSVQ